MCRSPIIVVKAIKKLEKGTKRQGLRTHIEGVTRRKKGEKKGVSTAGDGKVKPQNPIEVFIGRED